MLSVDHPLDPEELNEYVDGELSLERRADVESHLAACATCQKTVRDLRGVSSDLAAWRIETAPAALRVRTILKKAPFRERWRRSWIPSWATMPVIGLSVLAVLFVAVSPGWRNRAPVVDALMESSPDVTSSGHSTSRPATPPASQMAGSAETRAAEVPERAVGAQRPAQGARIIRTATLRLVPKDFDAARAAVDRIAANAGGYVGNVAVSGARSTGRTLSATVNVPAARLDETVSAFRALGEVLEESHNATDVTEQLVDLEARLANGRNTERRMNDLLRTRTGKLSEVLEAEREVSRVRGEIERLDAQRQKLSDRITYSAITLTFDEPQKSSMDLGPLPLSARIRNALVDGVRAAFSSAVEALLILLQVAPALVLWGVVLGVPVWRVLRRARASA